MSTCVTASALPRWCHYLHAFPCGFPAFLCFCWRPSPSARGGFPPVLSVWKYFPGASCFNGCVAGVGIHAGAGFLRVCSEETVPRRFFCDRLPEALVRAPGRGRTSSSFGLLNVHRFSVGCSSQTVSARLLLFLCSALGGAFVLRAFGLFISGRICLLHWGQWTMWVWSCEQKKEFYGQ